MAVWFVGTVRYIGIEPSPEHCCSAHEATYRYPSWEVERWPWGLLCLCLFLGDVLDA